MTFSSSGLFKIQHNVSVTTRKLSFGHSMPEKSEEKRTPPLSKSYDRSNDAHDHLLQTNASHAANSQTLSGPLLSKNDDDAMRRYMQRRPKMKKGHTKEKLRMRNANVVACCSTPDHPLPVVEPKRLQIETEHDGSSHFQS